MRLAGRSLDVVGGAACAAHPRRCDLSRGVVTDDAANTVTFHLVAPNPEFLARLTLCGRDRGAGWHARPRHRLSPAARYRPVRGASLTHNVGTLARNPYFHEWSHAARPDGYPNQIVFRRDPQPSSRARSDRARHRRLRVRRAARRQPQTAANSVRQPPVRAPRGRHRRADPQHAGGAVQRCPGPSGDQLRDRPRQDRPPARRRTPSPPASCWRRTYPAIDATAPTRSTRTRPGCGTPPTSRKRTPDRSFPHARDPITIWNLGGIPDRLHDDRALPGLTPRPSRIPDPNQGRLVNGLPRLAASCRLTRTSHKPPSAPSAGRTCPPPGRSSSTSPANPSFRTRRATQTSRNSATPNSTQQINAALAAEGNNSPHAAALWARADRTVTDQAASSSRSPHPTIFDFVSSRVGNYQYSYQQGMLIDQVWVR